jgi:hypothetical protein
MNTHLQTPEVRNNFIESRRLIAGLRHALDLNYARVLDAARREWERSFAGTDPSDACVSVRITSGESKKSTLPCGGFLQRPAWSPLNGHGRGSVA